LDLAFAAGETPNRSSKEHFDELKKYFSDEVITDIVSVISIFGFLNRWNDTLGTELEGMPSDFIKNDLRPLGWS
jgi:alkylhydroperoxidase family enzyme